MDLFGQSAKNAMYLSLVATEALSMQFLALITFFIVIFWSLHWKRKSFSQPLSANERIIHSLPSSFRQNDGLKHSAWIINKLIFVEWVILEAGVYLCFSHYLSCNPFVCPWYRRDITVYYWNVEKMWQSDFWMENGLIVRNIYPATKQW